MKTSAKILKQAQRVLQLIWASPVSLPCFIFYILPCWIAGWYTYFERYGDTWIFLHAKMPAWLAKLWEPWTGQCVGNCIVLKYDPRLTPATLKTLIHEIVHARQVMRWGIFQPILYALSSLSALAAGEDRYRCNHFEIAARRAAGQDIKIK